MPPDEARNLSSLLDIDRAARLILRFVEETDEEAFHTDVLMQSAVQHQMMILGEAVKRLSATFRKQHPHIAWSDVAQMRDRLIHGYDTVDLGIVWDTAMEDIPVLLSQIEPLLPSEEE